MKKVLVIFALICSLACAISSPLTVDVNAVDPKGATGGGSSTGGGSINAGDTQLDYDPDYNESYVKRDDYKLPDTEGEGESDVEERVQKVTGVLAGIVGVVSVVMIIWGGIMYSMSAGDPGKTQLAKRIIITAIIGLVLSLLAYLIIRIVFRAITEGIKGGEI